jgi:hypothetical protein
MAASAHPIINTSLNGKLTTNGDRSSKFHLIMPCQKSGLFFLAGLVAKPLPKPCLDIDSVNIWQSTRRIFGGDLHYGQTRASWVIRFIGKSIKHIIIIDGLNSNKPTTSSNLGKINTM